MTSVDLRPARPGDAAAVAAIWAAGWPDGHLGNVPAALVAARSPESFRTRAAERVGDGLFDLEITHDGEVITAPCHRYVKAV